MDSISKQKKYLSENLIVENLRMYGSNKEDIKEFLQAKSGNILAEYLNNKAWNDDSNNNTKVFLVRDKRTRKIAYYYALNCGILYKELNTIKMSLVERECVEKLVKAIKQSNLEGLSKEEQDAAYELLGDAYALFAVAAEQPEKANPLKHIEDTVEQNDNNFDGIINNTPTVDELEAKVKAGETISLVDLANAVKADKERGKEAKPEKKPSIRAQLRADKEKAQKKNAKQKLQDLERS